MDSESAVPEDDAAISRIAAILREAKGVDFSDYRQDLTQDPPYAVKRRRHAAAGRKARPRGRGR